jgi:hypothetical protein
MDCADDWYVNLKIYISEMISDNYGYTPVAYILMHYIKDLD